MKKTIAEISPELPANRKKIIAIKVMLAMFILLFIIPLLMVIATGYFTNKGIMMDAYLMSHEYTTITSDFFNKNNRCPRTKDIKVAIKKTDSIAAMTFTQDQKTHACYIVSTLKQLGTPTDNKHIVLGKSFNTQKTESNNWQCYTDVNSWLAPKGCHHPLPDQLKID